ncbi:MAG TPA: hypothetical protein VFT87_02070 [Candidatus Saccharimonadales bacterium]|nr:hypothetical protein [Candidatus Saccharimonadales bacterium]
MSTSTKQVQFTLFMIDCWSIALTAAHLGLNLTLFEAAGFTLVVGAAITIGAFQGAYARGFIDTWLLESIVAIGVGLAGGFGVYCLTCPFLFSFG